MNKGAHPRDGGNGGGMEVMEVEMEVGWSGTRSSSNNQGNEQQMYAQVLLILTNAVQITPRMEHEHRKVALKIPEEP